MSQTVVSKGDGGGNVAQAIRAVKTISKSQMKNLERFKQEIVWCWGFGFDLATLDTLATLLVTAFAFFAFFRFGLAGLGAGFPVGKIH